MFWGEGVEWWVGHDGKTLIQILKSLIAWNFHVSKAFCEFRSKKLISEILQKYRLKTSLMFSAFQIDVYSIWC